VTVGGRDISGGDSLAAQAAENAADARPRSTGPVPAVSTPKSIRTLIRTRRPSRMRSNAHVPVTIGGGDVDGKTDDGDSDGKTDDGKTTAATGQ
jgi:hypothetical protein